MNKTIEVFYEIVVLIEQDLRDSGSDVSELFSRVGRDGMLSLAVTLTEGYEGGSVEDYVYSRIRKGGRS